MHIYGYGSICRGEISADSDIDLLVIDGNRLVHLDPDTYSIYSPERIEELWHEGNPFAWHLSLEARILYSSDGQDYLRNLGDPRRYQNSARDCQNFTDLFHEAYASLINDVGSRIFDLSSIFLSVRNIATCFSLGVMNRPDFSRSSALHLGADSVPISQASYQILERARILCTRGYGSPITRAEIVIVMEQLGSLSEWMNRIAKRAAEYERV
jgi:hypothetical protein